MTAPDRLDSGLPEILEHLYLGQRPVYADAAVRVAAASSRTRGWTRPGHWFSAVLLPRQAVASARLPWRTILVVGLVTLALAAGAAIVGSRQLARQLPSTGPASNGLVAYTAAGDLYVGDPGTGQTTAIVTGAAVDASPKFSPDGTHIAFMRGEAMTPEASIIVVGPDRSDERVVVPENFPGRGLGDFSWTPDGAAILVNHDVGRGPEGGFVSLFDVSGADEPRLLTPPLPTWPGGPHPQTVGEVAPMFRPPTGDRILSYEFDTKALVEMDVDGSDRKTLIDPGRADATFRAISGPVWSPDARWIAFLGTDGPCCAYGGGDATAFVMDANGGKIRRLTHERPPASGDLLREDSLAWSPDGSKLLLDRWMIQNASAAAGKPAYPWRHQIVVVEVVNGDERAITQPSIIVGKQDPYPRWEAMTPISRASWSPDGRSVIVWRGPSARTIVVDLETGGESELPWLMDAQPSWQRVAAE